VDGSDAAHKLALLARVAFGMEVPFNQIHRRGINEVHPVDIKFAQELGYTIKLLAEAWHDVTPDRLRHLALHVSPVLLRHQTLLAQVRRNYNAIRISTDAAGETLLYGPGAGMLPTASAVVADLIDLAVGRAQRTFQTLQLWRADPGNLTLRPSATVKSRFYLRLLVVDQPGVMADITRALADHGISIASVVQHEALDEQEGDTVPLVIMTHTALTEHFRAAAGTIDKLECVTAPSVYYPVAD
jgi:homoserine dehydrogenase